MVEMSEHLDTCMDLLLSLTYGYMVGD